jgi:hypothetical protein
MYGGESTEAFVSSAEDQRKAEEPAKPGKDRNDQCEGSHGVPDCYRTSFQASAAVQQWLDAQGKGGDGDLNKLMERVIEQRLEMPTQLVQDVTVDLECLDVDFDTPGLPSLNEAVCNLAERLEKQLPR